MQTEINPKINRLKIFLAVFLGSFFLDQAVEYFLTEKILNYPIYENQDALFGIPFDNGPALIFLTLIFSYMVYKRNAIFALNEDGTIVCAGLIFGGIFGNIYDRISRGFITDYITFLNFFSFNISDMAILAGSSLFFLKIIRK